MTTTFCLSGSAILRAGANAPALTEAQYTDLINGAEGAICNAAKYDFVAHYATLSTIGKQILTETAASYAALGIIAYDPTVYTSAEAQILFNANTQRYNEQIKLIEDRKQNVFFITNGA